MEQRPALTIEHVEARALSLPTEAPESDGTLCWSSTIMVLVEVGAGGTTGLGYTYGSAAAAEVVTQKLAEVIRGGDPMAVEAARGGRARAARSPRVFP